MARPSERRVAAAPPSSSPRQKIKRFLQVMPRVLFQCVYPSLPKTASLDKHSRTHTGERPFACDVCEQRFTEKGALVRHKASKHEEGRPHCCHICNKTFKGTECQRSTWLLASMVSHSSSCAPCGHSQGAASCSPAETQRHEEVSVSGLWLQIHPTGKDPPVSIKPGA